MIAFLHTSNIHIKRFEDLVKKYSSESETLHFVNETILKTALSKGELDTTGFNDEVEKIKKCNPALIICTCSTYGAECDKHSDIKRIDLPIVEYIVSNFSRIALAYTARSTREISTDLIHRTAGRFNKKIEIVDIDCSGCWIHFEEENFSEYEFQIAKKIQLKASQADAIFLAQASMEGARKHLGDLKKEILSSPEYGIQQYLKRK